MLQSRLFARASALLLLAPAADFADVPPGAPFYHEVNILRDTHSTTGGDAARFCAQDFVKHQAMAVFIDRPLGLVIRPGESTCTAVPGSRASFAKGLAKRRF